MHVDRSHARALSPTEHLFQGVRIFSIDSETGEPQLSKNVCCELVEIRILLKDTIFARGVFLFSAECLLPKLLAAEPH